MQHMDSSRVVIPSRSFFCGRKLVAMIPFSEEGRCAAIPGERHGCEGSLGHPCADFFEHGCSQPDNMFVSSARVGLSNAVKWPKQEFERQEYDGRQSGRLKLPVDMCGRMLRIC